MSDEMLLIVGILLLLAAAVIFWGRWKSSAPQPVAQKVKELDQKFKEPEIDQRPTGSRYLDSQYVGSQHIDPHPFDPSQTNLNLLQADSPQADPPEPDVPEADLPQQDLPQVELEDNDQIILDQLREAGSDLRKPHAMEFYIYFPSQESARKVAAEIERDGFTVEVKSAPQGSSWLCFVTRRMVPERSKIAAIGKRFNALAEKFNGEYDGWLTSVEK